MDGVVDAWSLAGGLSYRLRPTTQRHSKFFSSGVPTRVCSSSSMRWRCVFLTSGVNNRCPGGSPHGRTNRERESAHVEKAATGVDGVDEERASRLPISTRFVQSRSCTG